LNFNSEQICCSQFDFDAASQTGQISSGLAKTVYIAMSQVLVNG